MLQLERRGSCWILRMYDSLLAKLLGGSNMHQFKNRMISVQ